MDLNLRVILGLVVATSSCGDLRLVSTADAADPCQGVGCGAGVCAVIEGERAACVCDVGFFAEGLTCRPLAAGDGGPGNDGGHQADAGAPDAGSHDAGTPTCPGPLTRWVPMSSAGAPPLIVSGLTLVWTGSEVMVFGGAQVDDTSVNGGWLYNPRTDAWRAMSTQGAPSGRADYGAVWTGSKIIIWGGRRITLEGGTYVITDLANGGIYDPATDRWTDLPSPSSLGVLGPNAGKRKVGWTGSELAIFSGDALSGQGVIDAWFYDPASQRYRPFARPVAKSGVVEVWTGTSVLVWSPPTLGGGGIPATAASGFQYTDPSSAWTPIDPGPLSGRSQIDWVWAGTKLFVHGGLASLSGPFGGTFHSDGATYDPHTDAWALLTSGGDTRGSAATAFTGCDVLEVGGNTGTAVGLSTSGSRYALATQTWSALPAAPGTFVAEPGNSVWAGDQLIIFAESQPGAGVPPFTFAWRLVQ